ncbi:hypothetical protein GCM10018987_17260 [Streptomyces cremeus]
MRVLVVEDARPLAEVVAEGLRDQGMAVDVAHDGLDAAAKLDVNTYDVVVLDRDLPGIHGDTLCQMITERDGRVMVLMLTAADSPGDRVSGLTLGADDYLAKPFHFPELVLRIRALPAVAPAPGPAPCARRASNSTRRAAPSAATAADSTSPSRNSRSSKPSWTRAPPSSAWKASSNRSGTNTPTRSPTRSR